MSNLDEELSSYKEKEAPFMGSTEVAVTSTISFIVANGFLLVGVRGYLDA